MKRFDGAPVWLNLPADLQSQLGALVVEWGYSALLSIQMRDDDDVDMEDITQSQRAVDHASIYLETELLAALAGHLPEIEDAAHPPVPSLLGQVCEGCGCSDGDACPGGCHWLRPNLCSACPPDHCLAHAPPVRLEGPEQLCPLCDANK